MRSTPESYPNRIPVQKAIHPRNFIENRLQFVRYSVNSPEFGENPGKYFHLFSQDLIVICRSQNIRERGSLIYRSNNAYYDSKTEVSVWYVPLSVPLHEVQRLKIEVST